MESHYQSDDWKSEVGHAAGRFLITAAAMTPVIVFAVAAGMFLNSLPAPPFGFECRSVPVSARRINAKGEDPKVIPLAPARSAKPEGSIVVEPVTSSSSQR
jgi:hypothetical protein